MTSRVPKSISATIEEWAKIDEMAFAMRMSRSEFLIHTALASIQTTKGYSKFDAEFLNQISAIENDVSTLKNFILGLQSTIHEEAPSIIIEEAKPVQKPKQSVSAIDVSNAWDMFSLPSDSALKEISKRYLDYEGASFDELKSRRDELQSHADTIDITAIRSFVDSNNILETIRTHKRNGDYKLANNEYGRIQEEFGLNNLKAVKSVITTIYGVAP